MVVTSNEPAAIQNISILRRSEKPPNVEADRFQLVSMFGGFSLRRKMVIKHDAADSFEMTTWKSINR